MAVEEIDEEVFSKFLYTADFPDPDLILRTSGEERISNFLLCSWRTPNCISPTSTGQASGRWTS